MQVTTRQKRRAPVATVNITPLVDVLLILLVVLLLAMPMYVKRLPVDLPSTSLGGMPTPVKSLSVALTKSGKIYVNQSEVDLEALKKMVNASTTVELSIDKEVKYSEIAVVVAEIQSNSPKEVLLLTQ